MTHHQQPEEALAGAWRTLAEEALTGMADWRAQHPRATLREIEAAVDERLSLLRARLLQDVAQASERAHWSQAPAEERPRCAACGTPLQPRGSHHRRLQTSGGRQITLARSYGTCPTCGAGLFPPR
jgi:RNase P subunit RPR2